MYTAFEIRKTEQRASEMLYMRINVPHFNAVEAGLHLNRKQLSKCCKFNHA